MTYRAVVALLALGGVAACSSSGSGPAPRESANVNVSGAAVVSRPGNATPYVVMSVTTSSQGELVGVTVDPAVAKSVTLTAPPATTPSPTPIKAPEPAPTGTPKSSIPLVPGQPTVFGPGFNGMWLQEAKSLKRGSSVTITLDLTNATDVAVEAIVR